MACPVSNHNMQPGREGKSHQSEEKYKCGEIISCFLGELNSQDRWRHDSDNLEPESLTVVPLQQVTPVTSSKSLGSCNSGMSPSFIEVSPSPPGTSFPTNLFHNLLGSEQLPTRVELLFPLCFPSAQHAPKLFSFCKEFSFVWIYVLIVPIWIPFGVHPALS